MIILFDFENIPNAHYQNVKRLIINTFGRIEWEEAKRVGAIADDSCLRDWNSSMMIYQVSKAPQAADDKLVDLASKYIGNRCIIVSNDKELCRKIHETRIKERVERLKSSRARRKTLTYQVSMLCGVVQIYKLTI